MASDEQKSSVIKDDDASNSPLTDDSSDEHRHMLVQAVGNAVLQAIATGSISQEADSDDKLSGCPTSVDELSGALERCPRSSRAQDHDIRTRTIWSQANHQRTFGAKNPLGICS